MHAAVQAFRYVNLVAYIALGGVTFVFWLPPPRPGERWAAIAFGSLGLLELLTLIPNHPGNIPERAVGRVAIALLVVFPYFLFRFTNAFRAAGRRLANALFLLSAVLVVWTFALPRFRRGEARSAFPGVCRRLLRPLGRLSSSPPRASGAQVARSRRWPAGACSSSRWQPV